MTTRPIGAGWAPGGKRPLIKLRAMMKCGDQCPHGPFYYRRSLVEAVISVMERKYGSGVSSWVWWRQFRELVAMCVVYNLERAVKLGVSLLDRLRALCYSFFNMGISTES